MGARMDMKEQFDEIDKKFAGNADTAFMEKRFALIFASINDEHNSSKDSFQSVDKALEFLLKKTERMDTMLDAAVDQIDLLRKRLALSESKLQYMADKLYPTFYKVFPDMAEAERELDEAMKRAIKAAGKKRPKGKA